MCSPQIVDCRLILGDSVPELQADIDYWISEGYEPMGSLVASAAGLVLLMVLYSRQDDIPVVNQVVEPG